MTRSGRAERICSESAVHESSTMAMPRSFTAGQISAQYLVQATRRSSTPRRSMIEVIDGCSETTRCGAKSPAWEKTGIQFDFIGGRYQRPSTEPCTFIGNDQKRFLT